MSNSKLQLPFILILLGGVFLLSFFILRPFLAPLALAIVFAVTLQPLYKKILKALRNSEALAALLTLILGTLCILVPVMFLSTQIAGEAVQLYNTTISGQDKQNLLITVIKSVGQTSENFIPGTGTFFIELSGNLDTYIQQGLEWIISHLGLALSGVSSFLLSLFIFFISFYYLLRDGNRLKKAIIKLSPLEDKEDEIVFKRLENAINSVIKGSLLIAIIQGILTTIGFTIFGIPNSILWGTITVIAALIPGIGTTLVILPAVVYLFIIGNNLHAVGLILWGMLAVGLIDNILGPKLVGRNLEIHPLFILLSVLGGIAFFGPLGVFLGPLTMSSLFAVLSVYVDIVNPDSKHKNSGSVAID